MARIYLSANLRRRARKVLLERDFWARRHERMSIGCDKLGLALAQAWIMRGLFSVFDWLQHVSVGYGRVPERALFWLSGFWCVATILAHCAWASGDFPPNSAIMLESDGWRSGLKQSANSGPALCGRALGRTESTGKASVQWPGVQIWCCRWTLVKLQVGNRQPPEGVGEEYHGGPDGAYLLRWSRERNVFAAITGIMQKDRD